MGTIAATRVVLRDGTALLLRSAEEEDAAASLEFRRRGALTSPYIATAPGEVPTDPCEQAKSIAQFRARDTGLLVLALDGRNGIVGMLGLHAPGRRKLDHTVELGMSIEQSWRGRGVGRAIMGVALDWAAANPAIEKVTLGVIPENTAGVRLYERFGFVVEGVQRGQMRLDDGSRLDHVLMALWTKPGLAPAGQNTHQCGSTSP